MTIDKSCRLQIKQINNLKRKIKEYLCNGQSLNEIPRTENFVVQERFGGTNGSWSTIHTGTGTNLTIQKLNSAYYRVAAHNSFGNSDWSGTIFYSNYPVM